MILGMDIGGTAVKLGLVESNGVIRTRHEAPVRFDDFRTPLLTTALQAAEHFLGTWGVKVDGIGVSATGQVDVNTGVVIGTNGKIPGYEGAKIKEALEAAFHVPTWVLNDANAAALGESTAGVAKGFRNVVMVTIGTGVGGGIIVNGELLNGARGIAGEIGHFTLYQDGVPCACGKRGCYECYASTSALVSACAEATGIRELTGRALFDMAANGDKPVVAVLSRWLDDIAAGLTGLVHIFNPEMIVIGGGVSSQKKLLIDPLRERVLAGCMPRFADGLQVVGAALGNDAGLIGASVFCARKLGLETM